MADPKASPSAQVSSRRGPQSQQQHPVPFLYRLALLYIEPFLALHAGVTLLRSPLFFLNAVSPNHPLPDALSTLSSASSHTGGQNLSSHHPPPEIDLLRQSGTTPLSNDNVLASVRILTDMLGIMHLVFAFNLAVVLRVVGRDGRLWRVMSAGMLLSDLLHIVATFREYRVGWWGEEAASDATAATAGGETIVAGETAWRAADWLNFGILGAMGIVRLALVLGIGVRSSQGADHLGGVVAEEPPRENGKTEAKESEKHRPL